MNLEQQVWEASWCDEHETNWCGYKHEKTIYEPRTTGMRKIINIEMSVEYQRLDEEKQAELAAALLTYYFTSGEGQKILGHFFGETIHRLIKRGFTVSEGTA